jgi:F-type H+-transporting ATPase subunit a
MIPPAASALSLLPLAKIDPIHHVSDGRLFFDTSGVLFRFGLSKQTFMFFLAGALTLLFYWGYARKAGKHPVPGRYGNIVESILDFIRDQLTRPFMGHHGDKFVPLLAGFFTFILFANLLGLIPLFDMLDPPGGWAAISDPGHGHTSSTATGQLAITAALALCSFCCYHYLGIREQGHGLWGYFKNLFPHVPVFVIPIIVPVELIAHLVRPCALAIRLFANMLAGHTMMAAILGFTYVFRPDFIVGGGAISIVSFLAVTALTFLELLVAFIQAFVFTFLTTVFLAGAVHPEH